MNAETLNNETLIGSTADGTAGLVACRRAFGSSSLGPNTGISSLEFLVALGLSIVLGSSLLALTLRVTEFQAAYRAQIERQELLLLLPSLLNRTLTHGGNGEAPSVGVDLDDEISVRSDLDGREGFPDGTLNQSFESVRLRAREGQFQMASGLGGFQSLVEGVTSLEASRLNPAGIRLNVTAVTELGPRLRHSVQGEDSEIYLWLWNYRPSLFPRRNREGSR